MWTAEPAASDRQEDVWELILARFHEIYPDVQVLHTAWPADDLRARYEDAARMGLGPDLIVAPSDWTGELADAGLIRSVENTDQATTAGLSVALDTLRIGEQLYGLPLYLEHNALYYNKELADTPATTLEELLADAEAGQLVAMTTTFDEAFWGISAFGGGILQENEAESLQGGGTANWLTWLRSAQDAPGMILNQDKVVLRELFTEGSAAYYVGAPSELALLQQALGEEKVGVVVLPAGPRGPAGPLLRTEAVLFNPHSSAKQAELAELLGNFLANAEQGATFMRESGRVPANRNVRVDARIYPAIAGFAAQARNAIPVRSSRLAELVLPEGEALIRTVLSGVQSPAEAATAFANNMNEQLDRPPIPEATVNCGPPGPIVIWHDLADNVATVLADIAFEYGQICADSSVRLEPISTVDIESSLEALAPSERPHLILTTSALTPALAQAGLVYPIEPFLPPDMKQRYLANALTVATYEGSVFGLPLSMSLNTFYYDSSVISDAPNSLDALLAQTASGRTFAFPINAIDAFWGVSAFSSRLSNEEGVFLPDVSGLVAWLTWLAENQGSPNLVLETGEVDRATMLLEDGLLSGEAFSYFLGRAQDLPALYSLVGRETLRSAPLPSGPMGPGYSLLFVENFLLAGETEEMREAGAGFAIFAGDRNNQTVFMSRASLVPTNVNVSTENFTNINAIQEQSLNAIALPAGIPFQEFVALGNEMYRQVLTEQANPASVACAFVLEINAAAGVQVSPEELGEACSDAGEP